MENNMSARKFNLFTGKKYGNVEVIVEKGTHTVLLHGNTVLVYCGIRGNIDVDNCGWITQTTRTAINTALEQLSSKFRVNIEKGVMYLRDCTNQNKVRLDEKMRLNEKIKLR